MSVKTRQDAWELVTEFTQSQTLLRHMLSVEAAMRAYARIHGEDEERWAVVGLIHDFDFERYPTEHPHSNVRILRERGWPEDLIMDAYSHGDTGVPRDTPVRKAIFAVDEMCGFVIACTLVKPDKSLSAVEPAGVRKKMKDKAFARAVHREDLVAGAELLGVPFDDHVANVRDALKPIATQLGLQP
ncbi:MAG TPA: HAD family hydrolase [Candidatus Dormibacteraeota bacterium]|nr:HAD family hydrolase [Candidatus Dormibacteraeota bacterium]